MLDRIEEFLQNLDLKAKVLLYFSILVSAGVIYYYFNYGYLTLQIEENEKKIKDLEKKIRLPLRKYYVKVRKLKEEYEKLKLIEISKEEDLKYLNKRIDLSTLKIDKKKFYSFLEKILQKSALLNLNPNFYIEEDFNKFKKYVLKIDGTLFECGDKNLFEFLKFLENTRYVESIDKFDLDKNSSKYFIKYTIWGIK